jgi:hypothetical protein
MHHGKIFRSHSAVKYQREIPLPGSMRSTMSISAIHALCCTISLEILIFQTRWILLPRRSVMRIISVATRTSCLVIGHGGSRYVLVKMEYNHDESDISIDNRMSLRKIQKTMERHSVLLFWEAIRPRSLLPQAKPNTTLFIFQMVWSTIMCGALGAMR